MTKKKTPKILKSLFIEDLGRVTGGKGKPTTLALGEEDGGDPTTMALGEEDGATTLALGEEDPAAEI